MFVVLSDDLIVFRGAHRECYSFSPRAFHVIKSVAHAPVALFARYERPPPPSEAELLSLRARVTSAEAYAAAHACELAEDAREELARVLGACEAFLADVGDGDDRARLEAFARSLGPSLLRLARDATRVQLEALHAHTERALRDLTPKERAELHVVVAGDHQARVRSLAMQYFKKRFGEPERTELHVSYAEGVQDAQAALELVGTQRLDRRLALAFFGEATRLQRDILGDAAQELLSTFELAPIDVEP